ncbi:hypothetical protein [Alcaligenes faecalis]|uniref:hypothetical protein n=1 Tax=Alcaligenes faecalis TaxID=511 RepID=UPI0018EEE28A|nr:hypothetical protein [Alcaligenes faecalis]
MQYFLEILITKQIDIYISLATSLIGTIFGVILDRTLKGPHLAEPTHETPHNSSISIQQVVKISVSIKNKNDDQLTFIFTSLFILTTGLAYLFFRKEVLTIGLLLVIFIFSTWMGSIMNSLYRRFFHGWGWILYLIIMLTFVLATIRVIGLAKIPLFSPDNFIYAQSIVSQQGITSLPRYFSALDFKWFLFHFLGIILLFAAAWRACLSMLNFAVIGTRLSKGQSQRKSGSRLALAYAKPWRNSLFLLGFMVTANYLVSGQFFMWFEYEMPNQLNHFIQVILHGQQAK